jgi:hypothetical protein
MTRALSSRAGRPFASSAASLRCGSRSAFAARVSSRRFFWKPRERGYRLGSTSNQSRLTIDNRLRKHRRKINAATPPTFATLSAGVTTVLGHAFEKANGFSWFDASVRRARTYSLARLCQSTRMISPDHKTASPQSPDRRAAEQRDERWRSFDHLIGERGYLG